LATKVGIPGLLSWKAKQTKKIKVFKAELEVKPDDGGSLPVPEFLKISSRKDYYNPNERDFSTVVFNDEEIFSLLQQGISSREAAKTQSIAQVFSYTTTSNVYKCNITTYIQDVMDGKSTSPFFNLYSAQWGTTVNRMLLSKGSVKLKIYYYPI
jgi:hypothetical protein